MKNPTVVEIITDFLGICQIKSTSTENSLFWEQRYFTKDHLRTTEHNI